MRLKMLAISLTFLILLPYFGFPLSYAETESFTTLVPHDTLLTVNNNIQPTNVSTQIIAVGSSQISVTEYEYDVEGEPYIQLEASFKSINVPHHVPEVSGDSGQAQTYPVYKIVTEPYPVSKLLQGLNDSSVSASSSDMPKYYWDGLKFVKYPGNATCYVRYDHPDNYDTYEPLENNIDYTLQGTSRTVGHIAKYHIEDAKAANDVGAILGALIGIVAALLACPEPIVSKTTAAIIAIIVAACTLIHEIVNWFLNDIVQTELGDGWVYVWGTGAWWIFRWFWMSFGAWRDWGWCYVFLWNGSDPSTIQILVWVLCEFYWNGAIADNVEIDYYDQDWNYLGSRYLRVIKDWL